MPGQGHHDLCDQLAVVQQDQRAAIVRPSRSPERACSAATTSAAPFRAVCAYEHVVLRELLELTMAEGEQRPDAVLRGRRRARCQQQQAQGRLTTREPHRSSLAPVSLKVCADKGDRLVPGGEVAQASARADKVAIERERLASVQELARGKERERALEREIARLVKAYVGEVKERSCGLCCSSHACCCATIRERGPA